MWTLKQNKKLTMLSFLSLIRTKWTELLSLKANQTEVRGPFPGPADVFFVHPSWFKRHKEMASFTAFHSSQCVLMPEDLLAIIYQHPSPSTHKSFNFGVISSSWFRLRFHNKQRLPQSCWRDQSLAFLCHTNLNLINLTEQTKGKIKKHLELK